MDANHPMFARQHLDAALAGIGVDPGPDIFQQLERAYGEPSRHYHGQRHVAECLAQFERWRYLAERPHEIEVAIWFHDAIYDARRTDNEARSAHWAEQYLDSRGADPAATARIADMILATKTHHPRAGDGTLMVDIDLGILGTSPDVFDAYDQAIRREYAWVPLDSYRGRRREVLQGFLQRDVIYGTEPLRREFEGQARANLRAKIAELSTG